MKTISDILFIISDGLLIPVVAMLLFLLCRAVYSALTFYDVYRKQQRIAQFFNELVQNHAANQLTGADERLNGLDSSPIVICFRRMMDHKEDKAYCEHTLADFQVNVHKELSKSRMLIKFGPMLGLMGTLIPMGPALVGLATGDIASMAYNMQVAFATTVVGMLVAGIGLVTLHANERFYARSLNALEFIFHKLTDE